jgi:hypothetical protein
LFGKDLVSIQAVAAVPLKELFKALGSHRLDKVKHFWLPMRKPFPCFSDRVLALHPSLS